MYAEILSIEWQARLLVFRDYLKSVMFLPFPTLGYIGMAARGVLSSVPFSLINLDKGLLQLRWTWSWHVCQQLPDCRLWMQADSWCSSYLALAV